MLLASGFIEALAEFAVVSFQLGQAAAEVPEFAVPFLAAGAESRVRGHRDLHKRRCAKRGWSVRCFNRGAFPW
jgi:hypothetical protein